MPKSLHVQADRTLIRAAARSRRHLRVEIVAPRRPPRVPVSLGLVLDRSGSMAGAKLDLAREGAIRAIRSLGAEDRLSVLAYNRRVDVLIRSGGADDTAKRVAEDRLRRLDAEGNTDLCEGWLRGCEQVGLGLRTGSLGRCLLLTDGLANEGVTDPETIVRHAAELRVRGVTTSTLGVGRDFDERLLRQMAEAGGGNFYFAEHAEQLSDFIAGETGEALKVVARDAALVVDLPAGASVASPNPFRIRSEHRRSVLELGDLVADQVLSLVLTVEFPEGKEGEGTLVQVWLWDAAGVLEGSTDAEFSYASAEAYESQPRDLEVGREVASAYAAMARRRAGELGRQGATKEGREVLRNMAAQFRRRAGEDPKLLALACALEQEAADLEKMDSLDYKRLEFSTFGTLRSRGEDGMTIGTMSFTMDRTLQMMLMAEPHGAAGAPFSVVTVTSDKEGTRLAEIAAQALAAADPQAFAYSIVDGGARVLDAGPGVALSRDDELGLAYALAAVGDTVKIAIVRGALADGAPSHWHPAERVAIASLDGWDGAAGVPAEAFLAYQMVLQGSRRGRLGWDPVAAMHEDRRGCWGDTCASRTEIASKLEAGQLCPECRRLYERAGVNVEQLLRLVAAVRDLAQRPAGVRI
jgi:Ca-activated chloride channel family protein